MMHISYLSHHTVILQCRHAPNDANTCPKMTSTLGKLTFARERKPLHLKEALQTCMQLIPSRQTNLHAASPIYKKDLTH